MRGVHNLLSRIFRRFRQLLIPFLIWTVFLFAANGTAESHVYDYVLYPNKSYWFLWALFFIVAIFNVVDFLSYKIHLKQELAMAVTAIALMGLRFMLTDTKLWGIEYVSYYFIYYIMAYYIHKYYFLIPKETMFILLLALVWFFLGSFYVAKGVPFIVSWITKVSGLVLNITYRMTTATIFIFMMFGLGQKIEIGKTKVWKYILALGYNSLGIYVVHMVLRHWLVKGIDYLIPQCPDWMLMTITFALLTVLSLWIVRLLGKWKPSATWLLGKV